MTTRTWATIAVGGILALLVVPFGGPYTVLWLVAIGTLVAIDLWWQSSGRTGFRGPDSAAKRVALVVAVFAVVIIGILIVQALT